MRAALFLSLLAWSSALSAPLQNPELQAYFAEEVARLEANCLPESVTLETWNAEKARRRDELFEMLSLSPLPKRTELKPVITGIVESDGFVVEKLHFQSLPGLYVTANFYRPKIVEQPLPTILYVCGHAQVRTNGVSYGNKTSYQHHGAWFARHGFACLTLDTIQLGEIQGIHHGTHREGMWWWNSRGYTPAGVEAWNCLRALDYLETRNEVDAKRFGVTGRSGGGAYSWWIAALDERIKVAAPVAGITDLRNHVVDGVVEGHCDCMFFMNTHRWDYPLVAALVAPRPLLICNSDKDSIFPLDGVVRTHAKVKEIYRLHNASANLGLLITEGPHKDTQDLQLPVFRWFNRHLKGEDPVIDQAATKYFRPDELRVFAELPADERTSRIHETFVPPASRANVSASLLREKVFNGWPQKKDALNVESRTLGQGRNGDLREIRFDSQGRARLSIFLTGENPKARRIELLVTDESTRPKIHSDLLNEKLSGDAVHAVLLVRGTDAAGQLSKTEVQLRRRYMLVGQTLEGMRVWDILRGAEVLKSLDRVGNFPITAKASVNHASNLMLAALFESDLKTLRLPPLQEFAGQADYLNFLRVTSFEAVHASLGTRIAARP
jgi:dienelactone hydrolase